MSTPSKLDALRQTAAERRAASGVPASVSAAAAAVDGDASINDLFEERQHDFDAWVGDNPPGSNVETRTDTQAETEEIDTFQDIDSNITTRDKRRGQQLTDKNVAFDGAKAGDAADAADADKISVVSDVTPPPQMAFNHPQINPFTPEWFAQLVGAAASVRPRPLPTLPVNHLLLPILLPHVV